MSNTILAIDIGSMSTKAVIADIDEIGDIKVLGHGVAASSGVKKGVITNIDLASKSIRAAVNDARRIAGDNISTAIVSISSAYTKSTNSVGIINISQKDITIKEINRVMETALYNADIPKEYDVLHVLPFNFKVDDQTNIEDPYSMNASRMEVETHIVIAQKSSLSNLKKAIISAGLDIESIVLDSYASALSTMSRDESVLGVGVIDMGGQTSSLSIFKNNSLRYNSFIPVGSNHITNDISIALHTPLNIAENLKINHGDLIEVTDDVLELPIIGDEDNKNSIPLKVVQNVIVSRVEETLLILAKYLGKSGLKDTIGAGIVLTGGMTELKGIREFAQSVFPGYSVRIGVPQQLKGLFDNLKGPQNSTVVGLILYKSGQHTQYEIDNKKRLLHHKEEQNSLKRDFEDTGFIASKADSEDLKKVSTGSVGSVQNTIFDLPGVEETNRGDFMPKLKNWIKQLF